MTFIVQPTPSIMRPEQALFPVTTSAQQPPTNTWCKRVFACHHCPWSIVIRTLAAAHPLTCLICHVCLCRAGKPEENMYESPTFLFPSSVPTRFFVFSPSFYWQYKWRGAVFLFPGDSLLLKIQVQTPTGPVSERVHSQATFVTMSQGSFKLTGSQFHTIFKWNDMSNIIYHLHFSYIMCLHIVTNMSSSLLIYAFIDFWQEMP